MHYYQFHIGDYASHTRHLSLIEDLAYRRLLDHYYLHEQPIKQREIARQIGMREHEQEVLTVLEEFFLSTEAGYINPRADKEIENYRSMSEGGKRGAAKRWAKGSDSPPIATPKASPIATKNHKPRTNNQIEAPEGVTTQVWSDFLALRKAKKLPLTETALKGIADEGKKLNWDLAKTINHCCLSGWAGFKASWVMNDKSIGQPVRNGLAGAI